MQEVSPIASQLSNAPLAQIGNLIRRDWKNMSPSALPYVKAMCQLSSINDQYFADDGKSIVLYFLSNAAGWRGEVAKLVKAELKSRCK